MAKIKTIPVKASCHYTGREYVESFGVELRGGSFLIKVNNPFGRARICHEGDYVIIDSHVIFHDDIRKAYNLYVKVIS